MFLFVVPCLHSFPFQVPCLHCFPFQVPCLCMYHFPFQKVQLMLLHPLESMTRVPHSNVRQKQMDCISHVCTVHIYIRVGFQYTQPTNNDTTEYGHFSFQILHSSGQSLGSSWSIILEVISSATRLQK